jgi:fibrillarin-like rRNA methylase
MQDKTDPRYPEKSERELLTLLYEAQEKMLPLIDGGEQDEDYKAFVRLVNRLEIYIQDNNQQLI